MIIKMDSIMKAASSRCGHLMVFQDSVSVAVSAFSIIMDNDKERIGDGRCEMEDGRSETGGGRREAGDGRVSVGLLILQFVPSRHRYAGQPSFPHFRAPILLPPSSWIFWPHLNAEAIQLCSSSRMQTQRIPSRQKAVEGER